MSVARRSSATWHAVTCAGSSTAGACGAGGAGASGISSMIQPVAAGRNASGRPSNARGSSRTLRRATASQRCEACCAARNVRWRWRWRRGSRHRGRRCRDGWWRRRRSGSRRRRLCLRRLRARRIASACTCRHTFGAGSGALAAAAVGATPAFASLRSQRCAWHVSFAASRHRTVRSTTHHA
jgi:hypothetical protein